MSHATERKARVGEVWLANDRSHGEGVVRITRNPRGVDGSHAAVISGFEGSQIYIPGREVYLYVNELVCKVAAPS